MTVYATTVYYGQGKRDAIFADSQQELIEKIEAKRDSSINAVQAILILTCICIFAWIEALNLLYGSMPNIAEVSFLTAIILSLSAWRTVSEECLHTLGLKNALADQKLQLSPQKITYMRPVWSDKEWDD